MQVFIKLLFLFNDYFENSDRDGSAAATDISTVIQPTSIDIEAARYVMHLLAEHKQTQVEVQSSMAVVEVLVTPLARGKVLMGMFLGLLDDERVSTMEK